MLGSWKAWMMNASKSSKLKAQGSKGGPRQLKAKNLKAPSRKLAVGGRKGITPFFSSFN